MKAIALFGVLALAKIVALAGYTIPLSVWTPAAYLWQDAVIALFFAAIDGAFERGSRRAGWASGWARMGWARMGWALYAAIVAYAAINVAVVRVLSSPITWPMMRAARGALSDSMLHHATPDNLLAVALVGVAGIALPRLMGRLAPLGPTAIGAVVCAALLLIVLGPTASARLDTVGLDRNPIFTLIAAARPRLDSSRADGDEDSRASLTGNPAEDEDLSSLRGAAKGRNVVVVVLESAGARYLKPYGAAHDPMPNLTRLAARGVLFERAYTVFPESIKTLYSILCARAPALDTPAERYAGVKQATIASTLKTAGYRTGLFHSGRFGYLGMEEVIRDRGFDALEDAGAIGGERESSFGVDEPSTVNRILTWVDEGIDKGIDRRVDGQKNHRPFFVTYLPIAGHHPYDTPAPGPFPDREDADRYLNALHDADAALGQLMTGLRARGLEEQTLFVVFGDHGEAFGQHEGNYGHSLFLYEENVHVPYVIAAPGLWAEPRRVKRSASLMDTAPTILDLLGLRTPGAFDGRSLLEAGHPMALFATDYSLTLLGLRDGCWKFIDEIDSGRGKLYDLCNDPEERRDLSAAEPARASKYRERLRRWSKETAEIAE